MSQQASAFWLVFCGGFRFSAAAETANAAAQAKLIKSTLPFSSSFPQIKELLTQFRNNAAMTRTPVELFAPLTDCGVVLMGEV